MVNQDTTTVTKIQKIKSDLEILKKRKKELEDKEGQLFHSKRTGKKKTLKTRMTKTKPQKTKNQNSFDPEQLSLSKDDIVSFCDRILEKWNKEPSKNMRQIFAMNAVRTSVFWTDEESLKAIWKEILQWTFDLLYENAKANGNQSNLDWTKTLSQIKK
jgi:hypothetical protein